jgi:hypothetical protein
MLHLEFSTCARFSALAAVKSASFKPHQTKFLSPITGMFVERVEEFISLLTKHFILQLGL